MHAHVRNPIHGDVAPGEIDLLREYLEERWDDHRPSGPVAWAPPPDDDDGDDDDDDDDDDGGDDGNGDDDDDDSGNGDGDDDDDDDGDEKLTQAQRENEALKRRLADETKKRKAAERKEQQRKRKEQNEQGQHKERADELEGENSELKGIIRKDRYRSAVTEVATRLRFKDPALAVNMLPPKLIEEAVDEDYDVDDSLVERELKKVAKSYEYLVRPEEDKQRRRVTGDRDQRRRNGDDEEYKFDPRRKMREGRKPSGVADGT